MMYPARYMWYDHMRSQGVHWVHVHPQGGEKKWGPNIWEKVDCTPEAEQKSFLGIGRSGLWERLFRQF